MLLILRFKLIKVRLKCYWARQAGAAAFSIITLRITSSSIMDLTATLSIITLSIYKAELSHFLIKLSVLSIYYSDCRIFSLLCWKSAWWMSKYWISLCWLSLCRMLLCWESWRHQAGVKCCLHNRSLSTCCRS